MRALLFVFAFVFPVLTWAQSVKAEYDKKLDLSRYKTYQFGEGEIITPQDLRQVPDATLHGWVRAAITEELTKKGLQRLDSGADLTVSYIAGSQPRSDAGNVGPLGMTPGTYSTTYMRDYRQGSLVIDLNDRQNNKLIWRVNSSSDMSSSEAESAIDRIVVQGFKKFSIQPKKEKKKK